MQRGYLVEQFGRVRAHQSDALNYHLDCATATFDDEYRKIGGRLGSQEHCEDRYEFQRLVATTLLDVFRSNDGYPTRIETMTVLDVAGGRSTIGVRSESRFQPLIATGGHLRLQ